MNEQLRTAERRKERIDRGIKVRTEGIYAVSSWQEVTYLVLPRLILIAGLLLLPFFMPSLYWNKVITIVGIYVLLALGFDFLAHFVGLVSLGGAFFIGVGGYTAAILNKSLGLPLRRCAPRRAGRRTCSSAIRCSDARPIIPA